MKIDEIGSQLLSVFWRRHLMLPTLRSFLRPQKDQAALPPQGSLLVLKNTDPYEAQRSSDIDFGLDLKIPWIGGSTSVKSKKRTFIKSSRRYTCLELALFALAAPFVSRSMWTFWMSVQNAAHSPWSQPLLDRHVWCNCFGQRKRLANTLSLSVHSI